MSQSSYNLKSQSSLPQSFNKQINEIERFEKIAFSGTCYWCMQAIFSSLKGVKQVTQGWIRRDGQSGDITQSPLHQIVSQETPSHSAFFEAVVIEFAASTISLAVLIEIHLNTHNPNKAHRLANRYPSGIYTYSQQQMQDTIQIIKLHQDLWQKEGLSLSTQVQPMQERFQPSPKAQQDYYFKNPQKPFCQVRISPKLSKLMQSYSAYVDEDKAKVIQDNTTK